MRRLLSLLTAAGVLSCGGGGGGYVPPDTSGRITFRGLDYFESTGDNAQEHEANLVLDPTARTLSLVDSRRSQTLVVVPYDEVKEVTYERTKHPRIAAGLLVAWPMLFLKGKKHWLTVKFDPTSEYPAGYFYARMNKSNARQIVAAIEAQTGKNVEILEE